MPHLSAEALRSDTEGVARLCAVLDSDPRCRKLRASSMAALAQPGGASRRMRAHFGLEIGLYAGLAMLAGLLVLAMIVSAGLPHLA